MNIPIWQLPCSPGRRARATPRSKAPGTSLATPVLFMTKRKALFFLVTCLGPPSLPLRWSSAFNDADGCGGRHTCQGLTTQAFFKYLQEKKMLGDFPFSNACSMFPAFWCNTRKAKWACTLCEAPQWVSPRLVPGREAVGMTGSHPEGGEGRGW